MMTITNPTPNALGSARRPNVVCLCGHESFRDAFDAANYWLTAQGCIVIDIMSGGDSSEDINRRKLELCDEVIILNPAGALDEETRAGIAYAQRIGKPMRFLEVSDWERPRRGLRRPPRRAEPFIPEDEVPVSLEEGTVLDLTEPFVVHSGAVLLYGADETRPAFTLVRDHVWPGIKWVPEVWYAEAASRTSISAYGGAEATLKPIGEVIRWAVGTSGQVWERMLWGLFVVGSVGSQEELSAIIGCRRESVTGAMRGLRDQGLIEKADGRIRLTDRGVAHAVSLCSLDRDEESSF